MGIAVLHVCFEAPDQPIGGRGIFIKNLMPELVKRGVGAHLLTSGVGESAHNVTKLFPTHRVYMVDAGVNYVQNNMFMYHGALKRLPKFDAVHVHDADLALCASSLADYWGVPLIYTAHLSVARVLPGGVIPQNYMLQFMYEADTYHTANRVTVCSKYYRDEMESIHRFGRPIDVIPNGVGQYDIERNPGDRFRVFYGGRIAEQKGIRLIIEAIKQRPEWEWVIAGKVHAFLKREEEAHPLWRELLRLHHLYPETVRLCGHLPHDEVLQEASKAHAWVAPSLHAPFELVGLEAMSCGVPLVCSKTGGFMEYGRDGENCLMAMPDTFLQCIERIERDGALADRLAANGKQTAREYSWTRTAAEMAKLYASL